MSNIAMFPTISFPKPVERFESLEAGCAEYIAILNKPANGWGQHIGPDGRSGNTLLKLSSRFGSGPVMAELDRQFALERTQKEAV